MGIMHGIMHGAPAGLVAPGTGNGMLQNIMRGLCTREKILCTGIMHGICTGLTAPPKTSADWSKLYVILL